MKEKLIIKNFGPIKDVELELGRFNVLIGENGTGKSTVAKVLAVCRDFSYFVADPSNFYEDYDPFSPGLNAWGLSGYANENTFIFYDCNHYSFTSKAKLVVKEGYDHEQNEITEYSFIKFEIKRNDKSNQFKFLISELNKIAPSDDIVASISWRIPTSFIQKDVAAVLDNPFYVPTQRGLQSLFSLGKNSIQNLSDALFNQLAELDSIARLFKRETIIEPLGIVYKNINGHGYIRKERDNDFYSLFNAASGYQSTIPIVLLVKYYAEIKKKIKTFIIEEPELNLFPLAQNKLMQFLVDKTMNYGNSMLLTTHSPYILTAANNLLYAFKVGQNNEEEINEIIDKKYWLDPNEVCAYRLLEDGTARNILDSELSMIDPGELDEVSRSINEIWDKIADVEFSKTATN